MSDIYVCCTIFFPLLELTNCEIATQYEEITDPADGYLTQLSQCSILVDAQASEMADWQRQIEIAISLSSEDLLALSIFIVGDLWALALAKDGQPGPIAAYTPDNTKVLEQLPHKLLAIEQQLCELFYRQVNPDVMDALFGALLDGAITPDDGIAELVQMLGCTQDWMRWSWYETIPEQLFLDPDLESRVIPLGNAKNLWER